MFGKEILYLGYLLLILLPFGDALFSDIVVSSNVDINDIDFVHRLVNENEV